MWHDVGKYQTSFQERIGAVGEAPSNERVDHSSAGAVLAVERKVPLIRFVIAGHHGGLENPEKLRQRILKQRWTLDNARRDGLPPTIEQQELPSSPACLSGATSGAPVSLWIRFLFSALVDADFLATERFYAGGREREFQERPHIKELQARLDAHLLRKSRGAPPGRVNEMRARVLAAARAAAGMPPGAFSLTVPTGGGKTLSSLAFALQHAATHDLERVIVVIPYTSIIEQTAKEYRAALGDGVVLEHHTNVDLDIDCKEHRLACENWDAPVVVTTNVQFFESLYSNRVSRCRKLHRIARSVVVFDEVQTFPVECLTAIKHVLRELPARYRTTTLFCTATQPTLLDGVREIVNNPAEEFCVVADRCEILLPGADDPPEGWEALAEKIRGHEQVLAIVHRTGDAQRLAELAGDDCLHLSARMCARHRSSVLTEVKARLQAGARCRVVATQLVEAGVDIDFPEVYRAFAGADSLAQAAGRCNREGRGTGRLHVFHAVTQPPRGILRSAQAVAREMLRAGELDLKTPATFRKYFGRLYGIAEQDTRGVMPAEKQQQFEDVAQLFQMMDEAGEAVVAPYDDWQRWVDVVRGGVNRESMRGLQPFMVALRPAEVERLSKEGALERIAESFWVPTMPVQRFYSARWGFGRQGDTPTEPED